jgi:DNA-binding protein HU-beta
LTKQEFIDQIASETGLQKRDATRAVEAVFDTIKNTLAAGGDVSLTGFGKFHVAERGPRQGVNPQTRERITIPGGRVPRFTAGSALKQAVKGGGF